MASWNYLDGRSYTGRLYTSAGQSSVSLCDSRCGSRPTQPNKEDYANPSGMGGYNESLYRRDVTRYEDRLKAWNACIKTCLNPQDSTSGNALVTTGNAGVADSMIDLQSGSTKPLVTTGNQDLIPKKGVSKNMLLIGGAIALIGVIWLVRR